MENKQIAHIYEIDDEIGITTEYSEVPEGSMIQTMGTTKDRVAELMENPTKISLDYLPLVKGLYSRRRRRIKRIKRK